MAERVSAHSDALKALYCDASELLRRDNGGAGLTVGALLWAMQEDCAGAPAVADLPARVPTEAARRDAGSSWSEQP